MKQKLSNYISRLLLFVLCSIFVACSKDILITQDTQSHKKVNRINYAEFSERMADNNLINKLNKRAKDINKAKVNSMDAVPLQDAFIMTHRIVAIEMDDKIFYTFPIKAPNSKGGFYNFVLTTGTNGNILKYELFKYTPSSTWIKDISKPFDGSIKLVKENPFSLDNVSK